MTIYLFDNIGTIVTTCGVTWFKNILNILKFSAYFIHAHSQHPGEHKFPLNQLHPLLPDFHNRFCTWNKKRPQTRRGWMSSTVVSCRLLHAPRRRSTSPLGIGIYRALVTWGGYSTYVVASGAESFNTDISKWDVSRVKKKGPMFLCVIWDYTKSCKQEAPKLGRRAPTYQGVHYLAVRIWWKGTKLFASCPGLPTWGGCSTVQKRSTLTYPIGTCPALPTCKPCSLVRNRLM